MIHFITETTQQNSNLLATTIITWIVILVIIVIFIKYINKKQEKALEKERKNMQETNWELVNMLLNEIERRYGSDAIKSVLKNDQKKI